jgi:hypothetical protein
MTTPGEMEARLAFTVATVWREERISCPHADILHSWATNALEGGAAAFVAFHLQESQCPFCNAVLEDLRARDASARSSHLSDLRDKLLRSTVAELRRTRA